MLDCTWISIPQARRTLRVLLSRPFWMWGAEMGANERGVTIGNLAVFTRFPVPKTGLTGMDLLRIALERGESAEQALEIIIEHIERFGQGGRCGYRQRNFRYYSSFVIADPHQAWILETAGPFWAARRVRSIWSLSNALTIGADFDRISDGAVDYALKRGWARSRADFGFAQAFSDPTMGLLAGAQNRRRCTLSALFTRANQLRPQDLSRPLTTHGEGEGGDKNSPFLGLRMNVPCAHATWLPTRTSGQTVGSMVSRLGKDEQTHWLTGTSSPCISLFKPVSLKTEDTMDFGPPPGARFDTESLFWRHEEFHRLALAIGFKIPAETRQEIQRAQRELWQINPSERDLSRFWRQHRQQALRWRDSLDENARRALTPTQLYWRFQSLRDRLPLT